MAFSKSNGFSKGYSPKLKEGMNLGGKPMLERLQ
jgi:hypothetical protein